MFWTAAILLTLIVGATIAWPAFRRPMALPVRAEHDVEVYDAQLRELGDDIERGAVPPAEAAGARAEIGRRLLKAAGEAADHKGETPPAIGRGMTGLAVGGALFVIAASIPFYIWTGAPSEPDRPLSARLATDPAKADIRTLVAQAEARLRADPGDGRGWEALVPVYLRMGRADDALKAAGNTIRLLGATPDRLAMRGEAEVQAASGEVTEAAGRTFRTVLEGDPDNGAARFYLAVRLSQQRKFADALSAWQAIVDKGPADAPWMRASRLALEEARRQAGIAPPPPAAPQDRRGPAAADIASAGALPEADRRAMIDGMVSQLAERLKSAPKDADGWKRLMRSYTVLGEQDKAREAFVQAQAVFANGSDERRSIDEFAAALGLGGTGTIQ